MDIDSLPLAIMDTVSASVNEFTENLAENEMTLPVLFGCIGSSVLFAIITCCCVKFTYRRRNNIREAFHVVMYKPSDSCGSYDVRFEKFGHRGSEVVIPKTDCDLTSLAIGGSVESSTMCDNGPSRVFKVGTDAIVNIIPPPPPHPPSLMTLH